MKLELFWCIITVCTTPTDCTQFKGEMPAKAVAAAVSANAKKKEVYVHCAPKKEQVEKWK